MIQKSRDLAIFLKSGHLALVDEEGNEIVVDIPVAAASGLPDEVQKKIAELKKTDKTAAKTGKITRSAVTAPEKPKAPVKAEGVKPQTKIVENERELSEISSMTIITRLEDYVQDTKNPKVIEAAVDRLIRLGVYEDADADAQTALLKLVQLGVCKDEATAREWINGKIEQAEKDDLTK